MKICENLTYETVVDKNNYFSSFHHTQIIIGFCNFQLGIISMYVFEFRFPYCCLKAIWVIKLIEIGVGVERLFGIAYLNN